MKLFKSMLKSKKGDYFFIVVLILIVLFLLIWIFKK